MKYHIEIGTSNLISSWNTDDIKGTLECWKTKGILIIELPNDEIASYNLERYNYLKITKNKKR